MCVCSYVVRIYVPVSIASDFRTQRHHNLLPISKQRPQTQNTQSSQKTEASTHKQKGSWWYVISGVSSPSQNKNDLTITFRPPAFRSSFYTRNQHNSPIPIPIHSVYFISLYTLHPSIHRTNNPCILPYPNHPYFNPHLISPPPYAKCPLQHPLFSC